MATIPVPKTPASAYNPKRRASQLLKDQVRHLEWAARPASQRQPHQFSKLKPPKTEAEAAVRIEALTRLLHPQGAKPARRLKVRSAARSGPRTRKPPRKTPHAKRARAGKKR